MNLSVQQDQCPTPGQSAAPETTPSLDCPETCHMTSVAQPIVTSNKGWIIDSGATGHLCLDRAQFTILRILPTPLSVHIGDGQCDQGDRNRGSITTHTDSTEPLRLAAVLLESDIRYNLIAVNRLGEVYKSTFGNGPMPYIRQVRPGHRRGQS
ncbi:MAG: hypothetical protein M1813_007294 [Trichoglossum hirsutum]|nr:MAG: hypothetical protein M1813_007294 [Trichoglossum hirsutum]